MEKRIYTEKSPKISRLGFGAWPLGNYAHDHQMTDEEGVLLVKEAVKLGINFFDTAPNYGLGKSETILGKAIKGIRENVVINTKFGHQANGEINFDANHIKKSIQDSLERLQTDYIDSVILHNPDISILEGKTDHISILKELKKEGTIRAYGVSVDLPKEIETVLQHIDIDIIEILFNVFSQANKHYFKQLKEKGIKIIVKVPLDSGWLTGKYNHHSTFDDIRKRWTQTDKNRRHDLVKKLEHIIQEPLQPKYAIAYVLSFPEITTVIPGIRNIKQLKDHYNSMNYTLSNEIKKDFENLYDNEIAKNPLPW
jgi:aryl-alcohol dehydrogenase-like predicted oxidoreductase